MPIRFRCVYCEQLLGIARRKAGTVVKCPSCAGQLIVPTADPAAVGTAEHDDDATAAAPEKEYRASRATAKAPAATASRTDPTEGGMLFERNDFDELLRPAVKKGSGHGDAGRMPPKPPPPAFELSDLPAPVPIHVPAAPLPPVIAPAVPAPKRRSGIFLSPLLIVLLLGFIFVSVSGSFVVGLIVGRMIAK